MESVAVDFSTMSVDEDDQWTTVSSTKKRGPSSSIRSNGAPTLQPTRVPKPAQFANNGEQNPNVKPNPFHSPKQQHYKNGPRQNTTVLSRNGSSTNTNPAMIAGAPNSFMKVRGSRSVDCNSNFGGSTLSLSRNNSAIAEGPLSLSRTNSTLLPPVLTGDLVKDEEARKEYQAKLKKMKNRGCGAENSFGVNEAPNNINWRDGSAMNTTHPKVTAFVNLPVYRKTKKSASTASTTAVEIDLATIEAAGIAGEPNMDADDTDDEQDENTIPPAHVKTKPLSRTNTAPREGFPKSSYVPPHLRGDMQNVKTSASNSLNLSRSPSQLYDIQPDTLLILEDTPVIKEEDGEDNPVRYT